MILKDQCFDFFDKIMLTQYAIFYQNEDWINQIALHSFYFLDDENCFFSNI